jgi:hypothetical protein
MQERHDRHEGRFDRSGRRFSGQDDMRRERQRQDPSDSRGEGDLEDEDYWQEPSRIYAQRSSHESGRGERGGQSWEERLAQSGMGRHAGMGGPYGQGRGQGAYGQGGAHSYGRSDYYGQSDYDPGIGVGPGGFGATSGAWRRPGESTTGPGWAGSGGAGSWQEGQQGPHYGRGPKGWTRSKERIIDDVCEALQQDAWLDASEIEVQCEQGEVVLRGTVHARQDKRRAEECAERIPGVRDVRNEIRIRDDGQAGHSAQAGTHAGANAGQSQAASPKPQGGSGRGASSNPT